MSHVVPPPDPGDLVELRARDVSVTVAPTVGGRIAQITVDRQPLLVDVPTDAVAPTGWGMFPMAPWAGRVRGGRFSFDGVAHQLAINHVDGDGDIGRHHSIHGTVFGRAWTIEEWSDTAISMSTSLSGELDWPFTGVAHHRIEISDDLVTCALRIDADHGRFPAEIGWHPWFRKPDHLEFSPEAMYRRDQFGIPTGDLVRPVPGPWDDCFVNNAPVHLHYEREAAPTVTIESDCNHLMLYDEPADATCIEPQSGPPDAFNHTAHVVDVATPLRRTVTISW